MKNARPRLLHRALRAPLQCFKDLYEKKRGVRIATDFVLAGALTGVLVGLCLTGGGGIVAASVVAGIAVCVWTARRVPQKVDLDAIAEAVQPKLSERVNRVSEKPVAVSEDRVKRSVQIPPIRAMRPSTSRTMAQRM